MLGRGTRVLKLEDLKMVTPEDDIVILTDNEEISMDHMDRVNESGVYIADYENEMKVVRVPMDIKLSPSQNAAKYYKKRDVSEN